MWDTVETYPVHLSHDLPCQRCGHAMHSYLPCSDTCDCARTVMPGTDRRTLLELAAQTEARPSWSGEQHQRVGVSELVAG